MTERTIFLLAVATVLLLTVSGTVHGQTGVTTGTLADGAAYLIEVPANWNGTLFLYSHGYVSPVPGTLNPARDVGDPVTGLFLLSNGFALAGSSYATTGWAIHEALLDQIAVLDVFDAKFGKPKRTIAWGHSLGGIITAGLIQRHPERFVAALPMCGVLSGGVATWNTALDGAFAFKNLVGDSRLDLVHISSPGANLQLAEAALLAAQATQQGRARLALAAALSDTPGWFLPLSPEPAASDVTSQEINQFLWNQQVDFPFVFAFRAELEARAQGNPSFNTGVDYRKQLEHSVDAAEVRELYEQAGLDLEADLKFLNEAPRISADPPALQYLENNIIFNGEIRFPVLTLHTTGDGLVVVENESAYRKVVREEENGQFLRQTYVSRAGHCTFTPAETIAAVETLLGRLETGKWPELEEANLNQRAAALGPKFNIFLNAKGAIVPVAPAFADFKPKQYLRPFDAENLEREGGVPGESSEPH